MPAARCLAAGTRQKYLEMNDTNLQKEMLEGVKYLEKLNTKKILDFIKDIKPPVLFGAMGSSFYMPSGRGQAIINELKNHPDVRFILASEGYNIKSKNYNSLILMSNSGKTREVISLAEKFPKEKIYSVTSSKSSPLGRISGNVYLLQSGKEKAVAATKSIVEQAVVVECLVRFLSGEKTLSSVMLKGVARAMDYNISCQIDPRLLILISGARTVYFTGGSLGIGEELALKFNELAKKKTKYIPGTQILHGSEEVIEKGDVVFILFADRYKQYYDRFAQMREKTGCYIFTIPDGNKLCEFPLDLKTIDDFKPYCVLSYFWNILTKFALTKGFSLDKGEKIVKVGVETKNK